MSEQQASSAQDTTKADAKADSDVASKATEDVFYGAKEGTAAQAVDGESKDKPEEQKNETAPAPEKKPEDAKSDEKPAEVKFELKLPEDSLLEPAVVDEITSYAKEKGLSPDVAQAILERESAAVAAFREGQMQLLETKKQEWMNTAKADKEIGGDNIKENIALSNRVIQKFASKEFSDELVKTGLGNHPELVRVFVRIGKLMGEDKMIRPGAQAGGEIPMDQVFYPSNK